MCFYNAAADGLEIRHAGIAGKILLQPVGQICLELRPVRGFDDPTVENAVADGDADHVAEPDGFTVDDRDVAGNVFAFQQRHPHVAGFLPQLVVLSVRNMRLCAIPRML